MHLTLTLDRFLSLFSYLKDLGYGETGDVDVGITFSVGSSRNSPRKDHASSHFNHLSATASGNNHDSSLDDAPRTAVEAILPWRRNSSFGPAANQENSEDNTSMVLKQEEFPPWISNKDYLPNNYASPTNTMLEALDRDRQNSCHKIPHVHEIFQASGTNNQVDSTDRSVGLDLTELNANNGKDNNSQGRKNKETTMATVSPFPSRASSRAEAVTAVNPAFLDDNDIPITKL